MNVIVFLGSRHQSTSGGVSQLHKNSAMRSSHLQDAMSSWLRAGRTRLSALQVPWPLLICHMSRIFIVPTGGDAMLATPLSSCAYVLVSVNDVIWCVLYVKKLTIYLFSQVKEAGAYKTSALLVNPLLYLRLTDHSCVALTQENRTARHCTSVSLKMVSLCIDYNHLLYSKYDVYGNIPIDI